LADCGSYYSVALVVSQEPVEVSDDLVVLRDLFTELHVNKDTGVIMLALQAESLTRFRSTTDGSLDCQTSVKLFEEDGSPKSIQRNVALARKTASFSVLNTYKGYDLHSGFLQFLQSIGKGDLVPDRSAHN
jgi:hypothetical protein